MNSPLINAPNEAWNKDAWLRPEKLDAQLNEVNQLRQRSEFTEQQQTIKTAIAEIIKRNDARL